MNLRRRFILSAMASTGAMCGIALLTHTLLTSTQREVLRVTEEYRELNRLEVIRSRFAAAELGISVRTLYYRLSRYEAEDRMGRGPS